MLYRNNSLIIERADWSKFLRYYTYEYYTIVVTEAMIRIYFFSNSTIVRYNESLDFYFPVACLTEYGLYGLRIQILECPENVQESVWLWSEIKE